MTRSRPFQNAFSSGEIDPLLHARTDFQRYQTGLAACRGFIPLRQGGFTRAPGTIYRGTTRNNLPARAVAFEFAANDTLRLEFTNLTMRVWRYGALVMAGGSPYELATPYGTDDLPNLSWVQDKDVIYLADGVRPIHKLSRYALDSWTIEEANIENGPFRVQNLDEDLTMQCSAATGSITITGTGDIFSADWVGSLIRLEPTDVDVNIWTGNVDLGTGSFALYDGNIYQMAVGGNSGFVPPTHLFGTRRSGHGSPARWTFVSDLVGIVRVTGFVNANEVTADVVKTIPKPCVDDATHRWSEGAWSERYGYPRCLEMSEQRLWAARTPSEPRTLWASTIGLFEDFEPSSDADGAFAYSIAATQTQNAVEWLRRGRDGIYIGALGEVYRGVSASSGQAIGPTTFDTELVSEDGASAALPISAYGYPIYITKGGRRVQELRYSFEEDGTRPVELSLPSQHLGALEFVQPVWQSEPQRLAWIRAGDGTLVVMTYDPSQDVLGWAVVPLAGGVVEDMSVTSGPGGGTDIVTLIVRREIDGNVRRYVEEQAMIYGVLTGAEPISEAVHSFAATVFEPEAATDTFTVAHLVGEDVCAWTDRGEYGPFTVPPGGDITLPVEVGRAVIGMVDAGHYVETLDIPAQARDGSSRGRLRRLHSASGIDLYQVAAGRVAAVERKFGQADHVGPPIDLIPHQIAADLNLAYSGTARVAAITGHADAVRMRFYPVGAAPMTVTGITPNIEEADA